MYIIGCQKKTSHEKKQATLMPTAHRARCLKSPLNSEKQRWHIAFRDLTQKKEGARKEKCVSPKDIIWCEK